MMALGEEGKLESLMYVGIGIGRGGNKRWGMRITTPCGVSSKST